LAKMILKVGFYWPTLKVDATILVWKYEKYQFNSKISHVPQYEIIFIS
jgi:hypothetical protein